MRPLALQGLSPLWRGVGRLLQLALCEWSCSDIGCRPLALSPKLLAGSEQAENATDQGVGVPKKIPALHRGVALSRSKRKQIGAIQILVLGFEDLTFVGDIVPELKRVSELDVIGLVDMVIVAESGSGELFRVQAGSLSDNEVARSDRSRSFSSGLRPTMSTRQTSRRRR